MAKWLEKMTRWLEKIRAVHLAYLLLTLVVFTSVFSVLGCISEAPGIHQLFIAELHDSNVQFGYIGICSTIPDHDRVCIPGPGRSPSDLAKKLSLPLDVIKHVLALQSCVSLALPAISGILILGGHVAFLIAFFSTSEKSVKSRHRWITITRIILWSAVVAAFAAAYLLNFSISAMKEVVPKSSAGLAVMRGRSLQVLQWMVFSFTVLYVGMVLHILHKIVKQAREGILPNCEVRGEDITETEEENAMKKDEEDREKEKEDKKKEENDKKKDREREAATAASNLLAFSQINNPFSPF
ncbi:hypothetical protein ACLOAV_001181 [Pseudogymnoascus australis]